MAKERLSPIEKERYLCWHKENADHYRVGKEKREKQTYYTRFPSKKDDGKEFLTEIVKPFLKIILELEK